MILIQKEVKKKRILFLTIYNLLSFTIYGQVHSELSRLKSLIETQIEIDALEQDSNLILFTLPMSQLIQNNETKNNSINLMNEHATTKFCYSEGFNLRFYLLSSNKFKNDASLKILKSGKLEMPPGELFESSRSLYREIVDPSIDSKITFFDYQLRHYEEFELILSLKDQKSGCAIAIVTVYRRN